jgi:chromosome segregation ATPase
MFSLVDLAKRIAGDVPNPSAPAASPELEARVAESERRRAQAEAELRREQEKKQEIKKAVLEEMSRLEAELNDTKIRVRRKDEEHGSALDALSRLKEAKELEWLADRTRLQQEIDDKEKARRSLETRLSERQKSEADLQGLLDASRVELGKLRADSAAASAERTDLVRKLSSAEAKLKHLKDAETRLQDLQRRLQESQSQVAGLQSELEKRDQRVKELQLLIKTLGDRLNQLADRRNV